jgi:2-phosphosulfolactate phosphatase
MKITTLLSPATFNAAVTDIEQKTFVVIDILRATSTMTIAMENGAHAIFPVKDMETALSFGADFIKAGERNGEKVDGFDLGNSGQEFTPEKVRNQNIVMTTTNGTRALSLCEQGHTVLIASYRNITATLSYLKQEQQDIVLFCSGWKDQVNIEDTLFAGELAYELTQCGYAIENDATHIAIALYLQYRNHPLDIIQKASHTIRISKLNASEDLKLCMERDTFDNVLRWHSGKITPL